jgi:hypothetical protein
MGIRRFAYLFSILAILSQCQADDYEREEVSDQHIKQDSLEDFGADISEPVNLQDTFHLPLDTSAIIDLLNITLKDEVTYFDEVKDTLIEIEVVAPQFACDCQNWVTDEYWKTKDLGKYGYFIEPADSSIQLNEHVGVFRNRVKLIGRYRFENDLRLNTHLSDTIRVFTYYAYEVLLPIRVYGPLYYSGKTELPNDDEEMVVRAVIEIR